MDRGIAMFVTSERALTVHVTYAPAFDKPGEAATSYTFHFVGTKQPALRAPRNARSGRIFSCCGERSVQFFDWISEIATPYADPDYFPLVLPAGSSTIYVISTGSEEGNLWENGLITWRGLRVEPPQN
jgi:hypothetical protein